MCPPLSLSRNMKLLLNVKLTQDLKIEYHALMVGLMRKPFMTLLQKKKIKDSYPKRDGLGFLHQHISYTRKPQVKTFQCHYNFM